jgi:hypothetical protein
MVSVLSTAVLTGAGLWVGLRRNRDNDPNRSPDGPTVQIGDEELRRAFAETGHGAGNRVDSATQVIGPAGPPANAYQPAAGGYQPAAGGYQPASGGYQPASGGQYPPPPPHAGPAYPPPPDRTAVYSQEPGPPTPPAGYPPPPPPDALFGAVPNAAGHETTALTPPSAAPVSPSVNRPGPSSAAAPFGVSPASPFGAPAPGSPWHTDPLTAPMPEADDPDTSLPGIRQWTNEEPPRS